VSWFHRDVHARQLEPHPRQHALPPIFGKNVEDAFGHLRYLVFYIAGGFAATMTQTAVTLLFGTASAARVPTLGASGAIAAVLGAFFILYPGARIRTLVLAPSNISDERTLPRVDAKPMPRRMAPLPTGARERRQRRPPEWQPPGSGTRHGCKASAGSCRHSPTPTNRGGDDDEDGPRAEA
jgi:Rhomboid family